MADKLVARPVEPGDVSHVAYNLCELERETLREMHGPNVDFRNMVAEHVLRSRPVRAVAKAGGHQPALALVGVIPLSLLRGTGSIWFLATDAAFERPGRLVRPSRGYIQELLTQYEQLENKVDARRTGIVRWLRFMGFTVPEPVQEGALAFVHSEIRAH